MRARWVGVLLCTVFTVPAGTASADVLVLGADGRAERRHDPGVAAFGDRRAGSAAHRPRAAAAARRPRRTVLRELRRIRDAGAIDPAEYAERRDAYLEARDLVGRLPAGRRRIEMAAAVGLLDRMAARGRMSVGRLEPLWLTLERNRRWWTTGPLLPAGRRVSFEGSELVFQYVPNQGLQLHPLANFGKLNALWRSRANRRLEVLLDELLTLPADRAGGLAWEYYFDYGGGRAPWVSGLAQGTGLQALSRAGIRLGRKAEVLPIARLGLDVFEAAPPAGVRVPAGDGAHYLIYSFNSRLRVLNGFLQALVGLYDFGAYANDDRARALFADGDRQAQREVPAYDTGHWSRYSPARESDLNYHHLVTGFLGSLCERTATPVYCITRDNFLRYLTEPPVVAPATRRVRAGTVAALRFRLTKISRVTLEVRRGERVVHRASMLAGGGLRSFAWRVPRRAGGYEVRLGAVDLAGNAAAPATGALRVLRARRARA